MLNSNTTLVKVKYKPARRINLQEKDSNTTLVKVKWGKTKGWTGAILFKYNSC